MATTVASGTLRILSVAAILTVTAYAGYQHRSPWIIMLFGAVFTVLYVHGKLQQWGRLLAERGWAPVLRGLLATAPIQIILAGLVYLVGYGLGSLIGDAPLAGELTDFDLRLALGLPAAILAAGLVINALEQRPENNVEWHPDRTTERRPDGKAKPPGRKAQPLSSQAKRASRRHH